MRLLTPPLPAGDDTAERVVLRDGSVARLRPSRADDAPALKQFFHNLSPESLRRRFFILSEPPDTVIERLCDSSDPARALTLLAIRIVDGDARPIAVGSYLAESPAAAEVAFAVDDRFHGKGIGTVLLERLAASAIAHGFRRFEATTLAENTAMLEVFRESGFEIRARSESGTIAVRLSLDPTAKTVASEDRRNALATVASLKPLLEPRAVAVVGASRNAGSIGRRVFDALRASGFRGPVYPINPHAADLDGVPCYASVREAPPEIDLAVVTVPRRAVLGVVDDCAAAGVKGLLVITAGFAEIGDEGRALQHQLLEKVRGYGMRMVGPNCMGLLNARPGVRLNASFSPIMPAPGHVALSSQSGALGIAILRLAAARGVGLSAFVSVGNKADVSGNDLLQYWEADPHTSVILLYLESFGNPRRFARLARRIGRQKPIVAIKAGRTHAGSRAAGSHTAALAASDVAVDAMFRQSGVIRAGTIDEMFDIAACLEAQPLPRGRRVAIVTNAGGPGILAVDACEAAGLAVPPFADATRAALATFLPPEASVTNPVDLVASAGPAEFRRAIEATLASDDADALIIIHTPVDPASSDEILEAIREGIRAGREAGSSATTIVACLMASSGAPVPLAAGAERVPVYAFPENAARALASAAAYSEWRAKDPGLFWTFEDIHADVARNVCRRALAARGDGWLTGDEVGALLGAFALPVAPGTIARSADEAAALARVIGFPVVAKLSARAIPHKSDIGAVRVNLTSDDEVRRAFTAIMAVARTIAGDDQIDGVLVQSMVAGGVETIVGVADDPLFGPVVAFGLGGVNVEVVGDVRFRIAPLTDADADDLLHEIRGLPLLQGYRGHAPADLAALRELLLRVSRLATEVPEIAELDLNPVMALAPGLGCRIVDARVRVRARRSPSM
jgi:acetyl coenzyme A synthetase (ADP forming)-like protein